MKLIAMNKKPIFSLCASLLLACGSAQASDDPGSCLDDFEEDKILNCNDNCVGVPNTAQTDSDGDGFGNACDADIAQPNDCVTNFLDYSVLVAAMFSVPSSANWNPDADFNDDGIVNLLDAAIFSNLFLQAPGPSGSASCGS